MRNLKYSDNRGKKQFKGVLALRAIRKMFYQKIFITCNLEYYRLDFSLDSVYLNKVYYSTKTLELNFHKLTNSAFPGPHQEHKFGEICQVAH